LAEALGEGRDVAGQAIDAHQQGQATGTAANHAHHSGDQRPVAAVADGAAQPQPGGHGQSHRHPQLAAEHLDPQLVGSDEPEVDATLLDVQLVEALAVLAFAVGLAASSRRACRSTTRPSTAS
jgi:hypothetical protein